ncbi:hypothetical protein B9Z65_288 [Elsinoe australis]|uniref:Pre-rRNA-processing protein IPI3 n=1 Tax=Elsinoe australis TaxID=40998 RepID=A0A2P7ZQ66_9PEZI|nr:hypothetical protein B9Z65_288 [Elsinoe australis]
MLTESLLLSLSTHNPKSTTAFPKEASIFTYQLQPTPSLKSTLKKSLTPPNCLASSPSHIFAAQSDKAVINVYSRDTGSLQTVVPFREKITSLALTDDGFTVVCGTEAGGLIVWETLSGRTVKTEEAHLGAVSCLVVDKGGHFALSGSEDGNVCVWNLGVVRSWGEVGESLEYARRAPVRTLRGHREGVVGLAVGRSLAISVGDDGVVVWDYKEGTQLRTVLVPDRPRCVALDSCERAVFVGFEDGSVVCVDFYGMDEEGVAVKNAVWDERKRSVAVQVAADQKWSSPSEDLQATTCMGVSYDSTKLITGHASGKVIVWDIPSGTYHSQLTSIPLPGSISNLETLPVQGFANEKQPLLKIKEVVKPRFGELDSTDGQMPANYKLTAHLVGQLPVDRSSAAEISSSIAHSDFERSLYHPAFPSDILADSIADLATWQHNPSSQRNQTEQLQADFMALDDEAPAAENSGLAQENAELKKQVAALQRMQKSILAQVQRSDKHERAQASAKNMAEELEELKRDEQGWARSAASSTKSSKKAKRSG